MIEVASADRDGPDSTPPSTAGGHPIAFAELYHLQHARLVRLAALIAGSSIVAEDIVQDAFAKLHGRWNRVDNPPAWLRTAVANAARNERRRVNVRLLYVARMSRSQPLTADAPANELIESLRRLTSRQRAVVVLRFYEDLPEAQIAEMLGMRLGTVKSTLHRALAQLRQEIDHD